MLNFLVLNFLLLSFLALTVIENSHNPDLGKVKKTSARLSPRFLLLFIVFFFALVLLLFLTVKENFLNVYLKISFTLLILGHARWISLEKSKRSLILSFLFGVILILFRFLSPSVLSHNLFIILSIIWLGPFFTKISLLTKRRFVIFSLAWFFYDIIFVWLSPLSEVVNITTEAVGFPLGILVGDTLLGAGDLLWSNLFISLLSSKFQPLGIGTLIVSNILLGVYSFTSGYFFTFPLLVLWIPLGLILLKRRS